MYPFIQIDLVHGIHQKELVIKEAIELYLFHLSFSYWEAFQTDK